MTIYRVDSRTIQSGDTFICLPGAEPFISDAQDKGCKEIIKISREELADYANKQFDFPSKN